MTSRRILQNISHQDVNHEIFSGTRAAELYLGPKLKLSRRYVVWMQKLRGGGGTPRDMCDRARTLHYVHRPFAKHR